MTVSQKHLSKLPSVFLYSSLSFKSQMWKCVSTIEFIAKRINLISVYKPDCQGSNWFELFTFPSMNTPTKVVVLYVMSCLCVVNRFEWKKEIYWVTTPDVIVFWLCDLIDYSDLYVLLWKRSQTYTALHCTVILTIISQNLIASCWVCCWSFSLLIQ